MKIKHYFGATFHKMIEFGAWLKVCLIQFHQNSPDYCLSNGTIPAIFFIAVFL
jgi:hypothetical protein